MKGERTPDLPAAGAAEAEDLSKGAWGGAWTVAYGCAAVLSAAASVAFSELVVRAARLGAAALREEAAREEAVDLPRRVADILDRTGGAVGASQRPYLWAACALGAAAVVAGQGVLRRSEAMRRTAIVVVGASMVLSLGLTLHAAVSVVPQTVAWLAELRELAADLERQGVPVGGGVSRLLRTERSRILAWNGAVEAARLGLEVLLLVRLAGRGTRAWCGGSPPAPLAGTGTPG